VIEERYLLQNGQAAWRIYDGEAVIVSPEDSTLHTLNEVGTLVWEAADGRTAFGDIVARICARYDVEARAAARDLEAFVEQLRERGLITVLAAPAGE